MNDLDSTMSNYDRLFQLRAQLSEDNKGAVFDVLADANITSVLVEFDGEGDSGQINSITATRDKQSVELPATNIKTLAVLWGIAEPVTRESTLQDAIETLCYDYLERKHGGWENNDGGFGEFHLDVATRTVDLEFHGRFTDTFTSYHTF
jgi:hypothetical protein